MVSAALAPGTSSAIYRHPPPRQAGGAAGFGRAAGGSPQAVPRPSSATGLGLGPGAGGGPRRAGRPWRGVGPRRLGDSCFVPAAAVAEQPGGNVARASSVAKGECAAAVWEASHFSSGESSVPL